MHDILDRLYRFATDDEAAVLDDLQRRAGLLWLCLSCHWHNQTSRDTCEQCRTHRYADLVPEDEERPLCSCGGELEPDGTTVTFDEHEGTGSVALTCRTCGASSTHTWVLYESDHRTVFGHELGDT